MTEGHASISVGSDSAEKKQPFNNSSHDRLDPKIWRVVTVVLIAPFMTQLDSTVVNSSLSIIQKELHSSVEVAQWIISGYLLALALMLPLNGWIVDRIGTKRLYLACFTAFTLASALCGLAGTMAHLILARLIQGIAGGLLAPLTQMTIARIAGRKWPASSVMRRRQFYWLQF